MLRRDALKAIGLSGALTFSPSPRSEAARLSSTTIGDLDQIEVDLRNAPQFSVAEASRPRHIVDFYWSATCKFSCITASQTIGRIALDVELRDDVIVRYTMVPRYKEEVEMGALMLSIAPAEYPLLCLRILAEGFRSKKGFMTIEEVTALAQKFGASRSGVAGFDFKKATSSLELVNGYFSERLGEQTTPAVYVDGRKFKFDVSLGSFAQLREVLS